ncbi:MAG: c-type cytochrome [Bacteroidota bacterium]
MRFPFLTLLLILGLLSACQLPGSKEAFVQQAHRSVLNQQPRILNLQLTPDHWLAINTTDAQPVQCWRGGIHWEGAVFTNRKTVQPISWGKAYGPLPSQRWYLAQDQQTLALTPEYLGYRLADGQVIVQMGFAELGKALTVEQAWQWKPASHCLEEQILLKDQVSGQLLREQVDQLHHVRPYQSKLLSHCFAAIPPQSKPAYAPTTNAASQWLDRSGCTTCHEPEINSAGPGYRQIATRYADEADALPRLVQKVKQGGTGVWGSSMMPPHPQLSESALERMIRYMLSFRPKEGRIPPTSPRIVETEQLSTKAVPQLPGHGVALEGIHPSLTLQSIRPDHFRPRVGGLAFLPDSSLLVSTWDSLGAVYRLTDVHTGDTNQIRIRRIAQGLSEPLGLETVGEDIYVLQKHELTQLIDHDGDGITDEYRNVCNDWEARDDFHEFSYGLLWHEGSFWANLGLAMRLMAHEQQLPDRGGTIRIQPDGSYRKMTSGLRQPNGIGIGPEGEVFATENQGRWVPACKVVHVKEGAFYGCRLGEVPEDAEARYQPPVVWLPHDEIGNSPGELVHIPSGPYAGQLLHGEVTHGGLKRVFVEKVQGEYQGAVFRFTQGLEAGINRLVWGPEGALYVGGVGMNGNWGWQGKQVGLQRLNWNQRLTFEMLAVRVQPDGLEIELTEPIETTSLAASDLWVEQWRYVATERYGGPKVDQERLGVQRLVISEDGQRLRIQLPDMKIDRVIYVRLPSDLHSVSGQRLWSSEAWYTLNGRPNP